MFGLGNEALLLGLIGVGLYAQSNEINLANNTTILLLLFMVFIEDQKIEEIEQELHNHHFHHHGHFGNIGGCGCNNVIHFRQPINRFYDGQNVCPCRRNNYCC